MGGTGCNANLGRAQPLLERGGSLALPRQPSMLSGDLDTADVLPLSQDLVDKPRACGGSTVLGAWEEEAALAALQSSRAASQHSAQQQAEDAAQRAAEAIRAQHEAEAQAVLDMFTSPEGSVPPWQTDSPAEGCDGAVEAGAVETGGLGAAGERPCTRLAQHAAWTSLLLVG